ncbi:MAG: N-6 DNA methylase [Flavobacteriaceae bacterium]|nr:N-6 DNA methylase [Flavobacteriaceae bacterium]
MEIESCTFSDKKKLEQLKNFFSAHSIDTGIIWTLEEANEIRKKISLEKKVNKYLVESLIHVANQLKKKGLDDFSLIHKIVMRSLFILYLEDRGAMDETFYSNINKGAKSYFDILNDVDKTYALFKKLEEHFNGNVFTLKKNEHLSIKKEHLNAIRNCFIGGKDYSLDGLLEDIRIFDFSIIQIELLSEIYENFLGERDSILKKNTGVFYTPPSLVELILDEKLPIIEKKEKEYKINVKVLDPACGSGIFLVDTFKRLVKRHEYINGKKITDFNQLKKLLTENIFGIEKDSQSIKVAAFSLYLALVDNLDPKTIWQHKKYHLPNLINNPSDRELTEQGYNLFCTDSIKENTEIEKIDFDLVVGNPPFGTKNLSASIRDYNDKYGFAKEMVIPFLHKATTFLGNSENGEMALIFNTKVLTNKSKTYQNFRKWLFNECYVEKIYNFSVLRQSRKKDYNNQLFTSTTVPISVLFYRKNPPKKESNSIIYYVPKTYIKTNVIEGISIDTIDVKYIPREEFKKGIFKNNIWKIAMWGQTMDVYLIKRLNAMNNLGQFIVNEQINKGTGLRFLTSSTKKPKKDNEIPNRYIKPENIRPYVSPSSSFSDLKTGLKKRRSGSIYRDFEPKKIEPIEGNIHSKRKNVNGLGEINSFRRLGAKKTYSAPHVLIKKGLSNWKVCASYEDRDCSFNSSVIGLSHSCPKLLKGLTCFINSNLARYYLLLSSASVGIERIRIQLNEYYQLPFSLSKKDLYHLADIYDKIIVKEDEFFNVNTKKIKQLEQEVDHYISKCFELSTDEHIIIDDFIKFTIPLMAGKYKNACSPVSEDAVRKYAQRVIRYLNEFLGDQNLCVCSTIYKINHYSPLMMIKVFFEDGKEEILLSSEKIESLLSKFDRELWKKEATGIYFRKKLNYKTDNEIFIIRPNQKRYWTQSMAMSTALELILEILNEV